MREPAGEIVSVEVEESRLRPPQPSSQLVHRVGAVIEARVKRFYSSENQFFWQEALVLSVAGSGTDTRYTVKLRA